MFVEGNRGLGKSTFIYKVGIRLNNRGVVKFNPTRDIVYTRDDAIKLLANSQFRFIFPDELINVAYNRDFYEQDQKVLLKALNMYRDSCNVFAGAIPKFIDLDKQIQRLCKIRVTIIRRGVALIQTQLRGVYRDDPWDIKNNIKIEEKKFKKNAPYGKITTVKGVLYFNDLTDSQRETYEDIKKEKRNRVYGDYKQEEMDPLEQFYNRLFESIKTKKISQKEFETSCRLVGKSIKVVRNNINQKLKDEGITERLQYFFKEYEQARKDKLKKKKMIIAPKGATVEESASSSSRDPPLNNNLNPNPNNDWEGL